MSKPLCPIPIHWLSSRNGLDKRKACISLHNSSINALEALDTEGKSMSPLGRVQIKCCEGLNHSHYIQFFTA